MARRSLPTPPAPEAPLVQLDDTVLRLLSVMMQMTGNTLATVLQLEFLHGAYHSVLEAPDEERDDQAPLVLAWTIKRLSGAREWEAFAKMHNLPYDLQAPPAPTPPASAAGPASEAPATP